MPRSRAVARRFLLAVAGAVALLTIGYLLWYYEIFPPPALGPTPSWRGITPGQTTLDEALEILGDPDEFATYGDYLQYTYWDRITWGWDRVVLYGQEREGEGIVIGVLRTMPNEPRDAAGDVEILNDLVPTYGRPDEVAWGPLCHTRVLIWARKGVVTWVGARFWLFSWRAQRIGDILLFEPMGIRQFMRSNWPHDRVAWAIGADESQCPVDVVEPYPEDPFDWEQILSSQP